jgi:LysR family transcriptional regulator, regulator for bpeEF and oprC
MDLLEALRAFSRIAQCGSFSLAAKQLSVNQPSLSKQIASLERHLAVRLLSRTTRRVKLTPEGETYLTHVLRILDQVDEAENQIGRARRTPSGLVRIGSPYAFAQRYLISRVPTLLSRYPHVRVEIAVSDLTPNLVEQDIDVAIRLGVISGDVITKHVGMASRVAVAAPSYLRRNGTPATPDDLVRHECLIFTNPTIGRGWTFNWPDGRTTINVSGNFMSNSAQLIKEACLSGLGIAVMPEWLFDEALRKGAVRRVLREYDPQGLPVSIVRMSRKYVPPKTRAVFDFLCAELQIELARSTVDTPLHA